MITCFPINEHGKNQRLEDLIANEHGEQERISRLFPRHADGRVLYGHPMKNSGFEYMMRSRMEQFRQTFGGEASDPKVLHGLFVRNLRRLAHAYGFSDGRELLSFIGTLEAGDIFLLKGERPARYYVAVASSHPWEAHGVDLQLGHYEQMALNLSMHIMAGMTLTAQLFYLLDCPDFQPPIAYLPLCSVDAAAPLAVANRCEEYQYIDLATEDHAFVYRSRIGHEEKRDHVFDVKLRLSSNKF